MDTTTRRSTSRRLIAAAGAAALTLAGVLAAAVPASAAPGNLPTGGGTLTIHKFEQPSTAGPLDNSGTPLPQGTTSAWVALSGVNFTIQPITDVDLTTNAGWDLAAGYAKNPSTATKLGAATTVATGSDGSVKTTLALGAYLVTEVASPHATIVGSGAAAHITMTAAPFVVTVPIPTDNGTWNSDVHVYPKNSLSNVTKSVAAPSGNGLGSTLTWTIDVKIPYLTAGQAFTGFDILDALDAKLAYVAGSAAAKIGTTSVVLTDTTKGQNVALSPAKLDVLAANQGKTLSVTFSTTVITAGEIDNKASVYINNPQHTDPVVSNPTASYWGRISITKHALGDETKTLQGAQFAVYASQDDANGDANRISVGGANTFTTGPDGTVVIPGLFVSNEASKTKTYYVKEVAAPAGYQLNATVFPATLTANGDVATPVALTVADAQQPQLALPITGGDGAVTLTVLGAGLLLVALGVAVVAARRRRRAQH